jgi:S-adenosyl methyltransferase
MTSPLNTAIPNVARVYDYLLGGKDNYAADRAAGDEIIKLVPTAVTDARENRAFLSRAVRYLAEEAGIRQFLDIGSGLPTMQNVHQVAQKVAPESRVVYVDNDVMVIRHAAALMTSEPTGVVKVIDGDLLDPDDLIATARDHLDFTQPVGVLLIAILHFIGDASDPWQIIATLMDATPTGSYLAISHATTDNLADYARADIEAGLQQVYSATESRGVVPRPFGEVQRFLGGLVLVPPGLVDIAAWRPAGDPQETDFYGFVATKP